MLSRLRRIPAKPWPVAVALAVAVGIAVAIGSVGVARHTSERARHPYIAGAPPLALTSDGPSAVPAKEQHSGTPVTTRLVVASAAIDLPVVQGDGVVVPLHLAVHYPGTDQPGGGSNALYYAHAQPGMFQGLYRVHPGDEIRAIRSDATEVRYRVHAIRRVQYNDRSVLQPTPFEAISLLTCTSYDPQTPRLVVIGLRV